MATQAGPPQSGGSPKAGPTKMTPPGPANTRQDPPRPATYHVTGGGGKRGQHATFQNAH
jgi:hypothetical protein